MDGWMNQRASAYYKQSKRVDRDLIWLRFKVINQRFNAFIYLWGVKHTPSKRQFNFRDSL